MNRLRPCPFCGSDDVEIVRQEDEELQYNEILCHRCGATVTFADCECTRGYETRSADETVRMWNMAGEDV